MTLVELLRENFVLKGQRLYLINGKTDLFSLVQTSFLILYSGYQLDTSGPADRVRKSIFLMERELDYFKDLFKQAKLL